MTKDNKALLVEDLREKFKSASVFYLTDTSTLPVAKINKLRKECFEKGVSLQVAKNTLIRKALDGLTGDYSEIYSQLHGPTAVMFAEVGNLPAKLVKEFRKTNDRPILKGAWVDGAIFIGDDKLDSLTKLKSKEQLLSDVLGLLQSPIKNVLGGLQGSGQKLAGVLKTLSEKN